MSRITIVVATVLAFAMQCNADACNRCGFLGRACKFQSHVVQQVAVAPVAQYKSPEVYVVNNVYPQPNGAAAILAQQGSTVYGYQQAAAQYFVNPADVLRQAAELAKAAGNTAQLGLNGYNATAQTQLTLQSTFADNLTRGQAASQVLTAAGFTAPQQQQQSLALRISRGADGQWQVTQAEAAQISAQVTAKLETKPAEPAPIERAGSVIGSKCASCHGLDKTEPKGGVFLDASHPLDCKTALKSLQLVKAGKMPKDGTLTDQEKGQILDELLALTKSE